MTGFRLNFIKFFYPKIKNFLWQLCLEIAEQGEFHLSAKRGILSLLEKIGKDGLILDNWRPLTLLNTDNKIYSKILATRMAKTYKHIIDSSQTGFISGRQLAENIIKINEIIQGM